MRLHKLAFRSLHTFVPFWIQALTKVAILRCTGNYRLHSPTFDLSNSNMNSTQ